MSRDRFVYVTYIRTAPKILWEALDPTRIHPEILVRMLAGERLVGGVILKAD